ncbi:MAG: hypothetical protein ACRCR4_15640 [Thiotrichaceae bacterium]
MTSTIAEDNYIIIGEIVAVPIPQDSNFYTEYIVNLEVCSKSQSFGKATNNGYVNQVTAIINADTVLSMTDFTMDNQVIEDIQTLPLLGESDNQYRTIVRVRAYLTEK